MLKNTFVHVPGVGPATERRLWADGFTRWDDYLEGCDRCRLPARTRETIGSHLEESVAALAAGNSRFFETLLPPGEMWRLYGELRDRAAFLDIETTGLYAGPDSITVIGLFDGVDTRVFVQGMNLDDFLGEVSRYRLIVTFNGKRFDVPFIRWVLGNLPEDQAHLDLLYPLRRLGYRGGLKSVEEQLGIGRDGSLRQVNGFMAVLLWREYRRGNRSALDTLVRYNLEDVVNLQYLADTVYNAGVSGLPIAVESLPEPRKYPLDDMPYDEELVEYLLNQVNERWP